MNDIEAELPESQDANLEDIYVDEYQSRYRQHVHTLLAWGYADSRNKVQAKHEETDIIGKCIVIHHLLLDYCITTFLDSTALLDISVLEKL